MRPPCRRLYFELVGVTEDETSPGLLGLWSVAGARTCLFLHRNDGSTHARLVVNIPDDEDEAERMLAEGETACGRAKKIEQCHRPARFLVVHKEAAEAVSFSADAQAVALNPADQFLLEELQQAESGAVSFGLTDEIGPALEKIRQAVMYYAAGKRPNKRRSWAVPPSVGRVMPIQCGPVAPANGKSNSIGAQSGWR